MLNVYRKTIMIQLMGHFLGSPIINLLLFIFIFFENLYIFTVFFCSLHSASGFDVHLKLAPSIQGQVHGGASIRQFDQVESTFNFIPVSSKLTKKFSEIFRSQIANKGQGCIFLQ